MFLKAGGHGGFKQGGSAFRFFRAGLSLFLLGIYRFSGDFPFCHFPLSWSISSQQTYTCAFFDSGPELGIQYTYPCVNNSEHHRFELEHIPRPFLRNLGPRANTNTHVKIFSFEFEFNTNTYTQKSAGIQFEMCPRVCKRQFPNSTVRVWSGEQIPDPHLTSILRQSYLCCTSILPC